MKLEEKARFHPRTPDVILRTGKISGKLLSSVLEIGYLSPEMTDQKALKVTPKGLAACAKKP